LVGGPAKGPFGIRVLSYCVVDDAPEYLTLWNTPAQRRRAYVHLFVPRLSTQLRVKRPDLVKGPFVGNEGWVRSRLDACGLSPPG
jgi:hypothetical protein